MYAFQLAIDKNKKKTNKRNISIRLRARRNKRVKKLFAPLR